jgi:hypothetical protein
VTTTLTVTASALLSRPWDGLTLTLAGVIYGIVVTVGGVVVAAHGTLPTVVYAVVALALLVLGLLFPQPVIGAMRRLVKRADPR